MRLIESKIVNKLEEEKTAGGLPPAVELYLRVLKIQAKAHPHPQPPPDAATVTARLSQGLPLLSWDTLALDWGEVEGLFGELATSLDLSLSLSREVAQAWYEGASLDEAALAFVLQAALHPYLAAQAEAYLPLVEQGQWRQRYCPICGGRSDFAYLDKEKGARWLICSRCDAEWLFQRLQCPYCGTQHSSSLAYFADEEECYRLYVCEECKGYLKAIDLRKTEGEVLFPLERVLTLDIDWQAREKGYSWPYSSPR